VARIGRNNPAKAMDLYLRMLEYHIPKLTRTEIVKPTPNSGRVIDSSKLTAEEREQMRQIILRQMQQAAAEPALLEQQAANVLEPVAWLSRKLLIVLRLIDRAVSYLQIVDTSVDV